MRFRSRMPGAGLALTIVATLVLAACGEQPAAPAANSAGQNSSSNQPANLVFFNARGAEPVEQALIKKYMALHPNVQIQYLASTSLSGPSDTDAIANLVFNIQAKHVIDIAKVETTRTPFDLYAANAIQSLSKIGGDKVKQQLAGLDNNVYGSFAGNVWALPYEYDPFGYIYNNSMFKEAGISSPPTTWDEWRTDNTKLKEKFPNSWPICNPLDNLAKTQPLVWGAGGTFWNKDVLFTKATFDNPGVINTYSFMQEWAEKGWVNTSEINGTTALQFPISRKCAAMDFSASQALLLKVNDPNTDYRVAPYPVEKKGNKGWNYAGGSALVIPSTSKYPKAALDFIMWLTSQEGQSLKYGLNPGLSLAQTDIFNEALPANKTVSAKLAKKPEWKQALATSNVPVRISGLSPVFSKSYQLLADMQDRILLKKTNVRTELATTQQQVQALIDQSRQLNADLYKGS